jgi:hypothetical protein
MEEGGSKKELMFFLGSILYLQGRFSVGTSSCYFLTDFAGRQQFLPVIFMDFVGSYGGLVHHDMVMYILVPFYLMSAMKKRGENMDSVSVVLWLKD